MRPSCLVALILLSAIACKDDDEAQNDRIEYELFPSSRLLATADLESIVADGEDGTLVFQPAPASLADIAPGMVLVGSASSKTPTGLIRGVGAVSRDGDRLTLRTMVVPIQFAFKKLALQAKRTGQPIDEAREVRDANDDGLRERQLRLTAVEGKATLRWVLFDGDNDESTEDDQVRLDGNLGGSFEYDVQVDVDWGAVNSLPDAVTDCLKSIPSILVGELPDCTPTALLPEVKATFEVGPDLFANADLIGSASLKYEKQVSILKTTLAPIPIGPIVLVPGVDIVGGLKGSAGARFKTGFDSELSVRMKLVSSTKNGVSINPPEITRSKLEARPTELSIMADGRLTLGARLSISIYGIAGPYAQADSFAAIGADISRDPCWQLTAGLSAAAGLLVTSPRLPVIGYVTLVDVKTPDLQLFDSGPLASGSCGFSGTSQTTLPGSGPSEQSYGSPAFTPWSGVASLPGDTSYVGAGTLGNAFCAMERATDGRFITSANGSNAMQKIDESGAVTWTRTFDDELGRLTVLRDTSIVVTAGIEPRVVRFGQSGALFGERSYAFADTCEASEIRAIQALDGGGYAITGDCLGTDQAYIVLASAAGDVRRAVTTDAGSARALAEVDGSIWWLGVNDDHMAAVRFNGELVVQASGEYRAGCGNQIVEPAFARPAFLRSELLVVGSSQGLHEGLFARLKPDASIAIGTFPTFGSGASDVAVLHAIAELPTTGYVVAGTHYDVLAEVPGYETPAPFLAWLDAGGSVLSSKRLTLDDGAVATGAPSIALTDDGGMMFAAARTGDPTYDLWTMKVFAKDASITDPRVSVDPFTITSAACALIAGTLDVEVTPITVAASAR
jgi:hypothetical protein